MAKRLKLYDRKSKLARHTGVDDGEENNVLNVEIKPSFMDKLYGDLKAEYETKDHYLGQIRANRLSDHDPLMLFLNANSVNIKTKASTLAWSAGGISNFGRSQYSAFSYQHGWKTTGSDGDNYIGIMPDMGHSDGWSDSHTSSQRFFPNEAQTFTLSKTRQYKHELSPTFSAEMNLYTDSLNLLDVNASAGYIKSRSKDITHMARYDDSPYLYDDSPLDATYDAAAGSSLYEHTLLRSKTFNRSESDAMNTSLGITYIRI